MTLTIELEQETDGRWIAEIPELPGVLVYGATAEAAARLVRALAFRVLADQLEAGEVDAGALACSKAKLRSVANALPVPPPGFDDLAPEEKVRDVSALWDRIAAEQERLPIADEQRDLLRQRLAAHRANPSAARPWSEVRRDIEAALSARRVG